MVLKKKSNTKGKKVEKKKGEKRKREEVNSKSKKRSDVTKRLKEKRKSLSENEMTEVEGSEDERSERSSGERNEALDGPQEDVVIGVEDVENQNGGSPKANEEAQNSNYDKLKELERKQKEVEMLRKEIEDSKKNASPFDGLPKKIKQMLNKGNFFFVIFFFISLCSLTHFQLIY